MHNFGIIPRHKPARHFLFYMLESIEQLHEEFINEQRFFVRLRPATLKNYESNFKSFIKIMPNISLDMLNSKILMEFFNRLDNRERLVGKGKIKKGVKNSTMATYRTGLNSFFDWLETKKKLMKNPFIIDDKGKKIPYPQVIYDDLRWLTKEEIKKIITAIDFDIKWDSSFIRKRNMAIFITLLCCGLRKNELLSLELRDLDLERKILKVRGETSKSKRDRILPVNSLAMDKINDYLDERHKVKKDYKSPYLFVSDNRDGQFTDNGFKHLVQHLNEKSGVKFHAHRFRHTFAVNLLMKGCDIAKLKELMGHRDIRMTARYLRALPTPAMRTDLETLTIDNLV